MVEVESNSEIRSIGRAIAANSEADPDRPAITFEGRTATRRELDLATNRLARAYAGLAEVEARMITIALPNGIEFFEACVAAWKLGATPHLLSAKMPRVEQEAMIALADPALVVGTPWFGDRAHVRSGYTPDPDLSAEPLVDAIAPSWKALCSGGSTGKPKIIVDGAPGVVDPADRVAGLMPDLTQVVAGPLYHNMAFLWGARGLHLGHHLIVLPRFDPAEVLRQVEANSAELVVVAPTMMRRIWNLGPDLRGSYDLSSLRFLVHTSSACPQWLKRAFIEWLGPKRIWETYSGTERIAGTAIRGDEWLAHPGSVGRVSQGRVRIFDDEGGEAPAGELGEIFMRSEQPNSTYSYIGADARERDGWQSLGDLGRLDGDGYLYISDRRTDLIIRGGANVFPAEVEAVLDRHPMVSESVVIGLPDEDLGQRVHAVVRTAAPLAESDLRAFAEAQLSHYKLPSSYRFTPDALRDEAGKVRRRDFQPAAEPG